MHSLDLLRNILKDKVLKQNIKTLIFEAEKIVGYLELDGIEQKHEEMMRYLNDILIAIRQLCDVGGCTKN